MRHGRADGQRRAKPRLGYGQHGVNPIRVVETSRDFPVILHPYQQYATLRVRKSGNGFCYVVANRLGFAPLFFTWTPIERGLELQIGTLSSPDQGI